MAGRLLGMRPASPAGCRLLELGCGSALNLAAMADDLPESRFVGLDASETHVARARQFIESATLQNLEVLHGDIRTFDPGAERYDYIVAHGVYSWVGADVRDALLRLIGRALAPQGLAFVSYNTYPGWFALRAAREMMLFHVRSETDPAARVRKSAELLAFLLAHADPQDAGYGANLARCQAAFSPRSDMLEREWIASICHDELSPVNEPVYFHEFAGSAQAAGLQFAAEADLRGATAVGLSPSLTAGLRTFAPDRVSHEQYLDFAANRAFRQTLLCRADVELNRRLVPGPDTMEEFFLFTAMPPPEDPGALMKTGPVRVAAGNAAIVTDHPLSKAALAALARAAPEALTWQELVRHASRASGHDAPAAGDLDRLSATLLQAFFASRKLVAFATLPDRFTMEIPPRPAVSPLVRLLAAQGQPRVPNRRHERTLLDPGALPVIACMDATRTIPELRSVADRHQGSIDLLLESLARSALLAASPPRSGYQVHEPPGGGHSPII